MEVVKLQDFKVGKVYIKNGQDNSWLYKVDGYGDYYTKIKGSKYSWSKFIINKNAMLSEFEEYNPKPKLLKDINSKYNKKIWLIDVAGYTSPQPYSDFYSGLDLVGNNRIRLTEKSVQKEVLFQQYLAKLYMACQEDSYNEPTYENHMYEVFYYDGNFSKGLKPKLWKIKHFYPKQYRFNTYEYAEKFCDENKELGGKVFGD